MASEPPAGTRKLTSRSTRVPPYANVTPRISTSPRIGAPTGSSGSPMAGRASKISCSRRSDAQPCWKMFVISPKAIIGQESR
ncbi:MAG: hypothetical protein A3H36_03200 [Chloroflexi bacterium RIFCSPLOWO2_02_FULL_71_16]|nr:MAG: hypothetical protein A3H36_03200 [Chloroflexi bacterium RIFCSPLOWO2_02_FULL_71_16]